MLDDSDHVDNTNSDLEAEDEEGDNKMVENKEQSNSSSESDVADDVVVVDESKY